MTYQSLFSVMLLASAGLYVLSSSINSTRFIHILTWDQEKNSTDGLCYTVMYNILNSAINKTVSGCECVHLPITCNLTEAFSDVKQTYYPVIIAILGNHTSHTVPLDTFRPYDDSFLDPPLLFITSSEVSMYVDLKPPYDFLLSIYKMFTYTLTITRRKNGFQFVKEIEGLNVINIPHLEPGTEYCVTVSIKDRKNTHNRTQCASTTSLHNPEKQIASIIFFLVLFSLPLIIVLCYSHFCSKSPLPNVLKSVKSHHVLLFPLTYDIPACSRVLVKDSTNTICQNRNDREKSNGEDNSEQAVMGTKKSTGNYERWTEQMDCCTHSMDNSSSTLLPVSPPSNMTENHSLSQFTTVNQSEFSSVPGSEDIPFKLHSNAHVINQHSEDQCVREQGSRSIFRFDFKISEFMINEQETTEEDKESCPDINLLSVTLGKHEEKKPEEQDNEDILKGSCLDVNLLSVTLGKHKEGKPEGQDNEDTLQLDSLLCWKRGDSSFPLLTDTAGSSDTETCVLNTEEEEKDTECSEYLKR